LFNTRARFGLLLKNQLFFPSNTTTYTDFIIPVLLHISDLSKTILRPTFNYKSAITAHYTLWDHKLFTGVPLEYNESTFLTDCKQHFRYTALY